MLVCISRTYGFWSHLDVSIRMHPSQVGPSGSQLYISMMHLAFGEPGRYKLGSDQDIESQADMATLMVLIVQLSSVVQSSVTSRG